MTTLGPISLENEAATTAFARLIAATVTAGDTILLEGDIGAGKSFFSRQLILSLLPEPEDVPSPTFTLVQTYDAEDFEIWHCDLYRLSNASDALELGLDDAFETAVCLIEWPDRLGEDKPQHALTMRFGTISETHRQVHATYSDPKWARIESAFHEFT